MALHLRKFLSEDKKDDSDAESPPLPCYICYNCDSDECLTPPPQTVPHHHMPTVLIVMLCVLAAAFLVLSYLTVGRYRNSRWRSSGAAAAVETEEESLREDENQGTGGGNSNSNRDSDGGRVDHHVWHIRTVGFPQSIIDSISVFTFKRGEGLIDGSDCSVCLNEFEEDESLRLLPKCSHAFHLSCIDTWLRAHKNCPVCRAPIMAANGENVPGNSRDGDMRDLVSPAEYESESEQEPETGESREVTSGRPRTGPALPVRSDTGKTEHGMNLRNENFDSDLRVLSDLDGRRVKMDQVPWSFRRSASLDHFSSDFRVDVNKEGCSDKRRNKNSGILKLIKSASFGRTLQKGPVSMKRSVSFSGKRSVKKNNNKSQAAYTPEIAIHK